MQSIEHWIGGKVTPGRSGRQGPVFDPAVGKQTGADANSLRLLKPMLLSNAQLRRPHCGVIRHWASVRTECSNCGNSSRHIVRSWRSS